jgi:hypothetical protein
MTAAAAWGSAPARAQRVTVLSGTVITRGERVTGSGSVYDGHGGITVSSIPDVWLRDDAGREHHLEGHLLSDCRAGHRIAVFWDRRGKQPMIAMSNLSTGTWYGTPDLMKDSTVGSILSAGIVLAAVLAIPGLLLWAWLLNSFGIGLGRGKTPDWFWSGWQFFVGSGAMLISCGVQTSNDVTRRILRAEIEDRIGKLKAQAAKA